VSRESLYVASHTDDVEPLRRSRHLGDDLNLDRQSRRGSVAHVVAVVVDARRAGALQCGAMQEPVEAIDAAAGPARLRFDRGVTIVW